MDIRDTLRRIVMDASDEYDREDIPEDGLDLADHIINGLIESGLILEQPLEVDMNTVERDDIARVLAAMSNMVYQVNLANGWFEDERTVGDDIALLHSEASEMLEAYRDGGLADQTQERAESGSPPKPEGFGSEAADVLIRLLDTCKRRGVNLAWEFGRKLEYNATRGSRHGGKLL